MHRKVTNPIVQSQASFGTQRRIQPLFAAACALSLSLAFTSCENSTAATSAGGGASASVPTSEVEVAGSVVAKPSAKKLIQRAADRWKLIVDASEDPKLWIDVYDYEAPAAREAVPLSRFLGSKEEFHYDNPSLPMPLLIEDDTAYLNVTAIWEAGKHSKIGDQTGIVGADPNRIEFLDMVETWKFVKGEWYFLGPAVRRSEFLEENPDIVRRAQKANEAAAEKKRGEEPEVEGEETASDE